ncbi:hypothetical protein [Brevibacillus choshinensis]|uniref:MYM-type domain-containing protein n=1 Tax=Brevibacillus choshinensis TaxID=54911 RepID=A0ABX7FMN9_BRECH|nr:hypothetical protein [Brevibacillus choshinensis]QRG66954.1 hypothetical protein JNE38_26350 [Brevibacillus choshinensis]
MGTYKESSIPVADDDQVVEFCDHCGSDIQKGQTAWKVGSDMYCSQSCLKSGLEIVTLRI